MEVPEGLAPKYAASRDCPPAPLRLLPLGSATSGRCRPWPAPAARASGRRTMGPPAPGLVRDTQPVMVWVGARAP